MNAETGLSMAPANMLNLSTVLIPAVNEYPAISTPRDMLEEQGLVALVGKPLIQRPLKLLRAQVLKRASKIGAKLIGVTSAAPDAGKSFVTTNLAATLAQLSEQTTMLFDLDLRRPSVAERFDMTFEYGIDAWLTGEMTDLRRIGRRVTEHGLVVFPANRIDDGSGELLASTRFDALLEGLRQLPDPAIILFDLPPAFVSDDTLTVIGKLDAYIHVVDEGVTPKRQAEEVRSMLEPATCLGVVLNRYSGRWNDSYGYSAAKKYSRYYSEAD
jgi:protein-tyrosine kinase